MCQSTLPPEIEALYQRLLRHMETQALYQTLLRQIRFSLFWSWLLIALAIAVAIVTWNGWWMPSFFLPGGDVPDWFSRSGAVVTILGLMVHMRLSDLLNKLQPPGLNSIAHRDAMEWYAKRRGRRFLSSASYLMTGIGTIIWGYGDLIMRITTGM